MTLASLWGVALGRSILCALLLAGCAVESSTPSTGSTSGTGGQSILPGEANADYTVTIYQNDSQAEFIAQYYQGANPVTGTSISFSGGESVSVNGVPLQEQSGVGVFYGGEGALVDPGQPYAFVLTVPGKGSFSTPVDMVSSAAITSPASGVSVSSTGALTITWSTTDAGAADEIDATFEPNGDGETATATINATPGATQVTLSATELQSLYTTAVGTAGGSAMGTLTLKRTRQSAMGAPFVGGQLQISRELTSIGVTITK